MVNPVLIAAPVTIIPAIGALWYLLKRYEDYFEDARVFLALVFGFFGGLLAVFLEFQLFPFADPRFVASMGPGTAFVFFVAGYALFETGIKTAVLGSRRFRNRKDTPFYGAAMGLGFGAMMALGFVAINLNASEILSEQVLNATTNQTADFGYSTPSFIAMAFVPLGAIFVHGAAGVFVGRSIGNGSLAKGWGIGTLLQMPVLMTYWFFWPSIGRGDVVILFPAAMSILYGILLLHITRIRVLDHVVPKDIRDLVRRDKRREQRRQLRDEEE